uniref:Uncharacterized protein n=1 Tax=Solanum lycopersicum TaxID=4081 RepID=A0A3Q7HFX3_SOLLC
MKLEVESLGRDCRDSHVKKSQQRPSIVQSFPVCQIFRLIVCRSSIKRMSS